MSQSHTEHGAALVEFAIALPLLLITIGGIADFGLMLRTFEVTANAAREGARLAAIPGNEENGYASVIARVTDCLTDSRLTGSRTVAVAPEAVALGGLTASGVRVTVTYDYDSLFLGRLAGLFGGTFTDTITIRSTALMRLQVAGVAS